MASNWKGPKLPWGTDVDEKHYQNAFDFLSLQWTPERAAPVIDRLRGAGLDKQHPGDLLRASKLNFLSLDDNAVMQEIRKALIDGEIVPVLIVNLPAGIIVVDGYHRISAAYRLAPFHKIPLKIVDAKPEEMGPDIDVGGG